MLKKILLGLVLFLSFSTASYANSNKTVNLSNSFYCEIDVFSSDHSKMHTIIWDLSKLAKIEDDKKEIFYKKIYSEESASNEKSSYIYSADIFYNKKEPEKLAFSSDIQILLNDTGKNSSQIKKQYTIEGFAKLHKNLSLENNENIVLHSEIFSNGSSFLQMTCFEGNAPKIVKDRKKNRY